MAIAGALAGAGASLYWLSGNTEFFWSTYQSLPTVGFNGIPVALLAVSHPVGVVFAAVFMSALDIAGLQLKNLTAYNEFITSVIIAVIVYMAAFSLVIKLWLGNYFKKRAEARAARIEAAQELPPETEAAQELLPEAEDAPQQAENAEKEEQV